MCLYSPNHLTFITFIKYDLNVKYDSKDNTVGATVWVETIDYLSVVQSTDAQTKKKSLKDVLIWKYWLYAHITLLVHDLQYCQWQMTSILPSSICSLHHICHEGMKCCLGWEENKTFCQKYFHNWTQTWSLSPQTAAYL